MKPLAQRTAEWLIRWRIPLLLLGLAMAAAAWFPTRSLTFDRSIVTLFADDDPLLAPYRKLKRTFGGNELLMAVYHDDELFHPDGRGIVRLEQLSERIEAVEGISGIISIAQPLGPAIVDTNDPLAGRLRQLFEGYTHSTDGTIAAIVCVLQPPSESGVSRREIVDRLREIVGPLRCGMLAGEPVMVVDGLRYVEEDGRRLAWTSTVLLAITIFLCFRSLRWILIPLAVVQLTVMTTEASMALAGLRLTMISSMLRAILTVVAIATVIHVIVRFRDARSKGLSPRLALLEAGTLLAVPIFWACTTDAVGFASLLAARVEPVQQFGLMMAAGSLLVIVSTALLVPGLTLWGRHPVDPRRAWDEQMLDRSLPALAGWVQRHRRPILIGSFCVCTLAALGTYRLEVETDFTRNFRRGSPVVTSYQFIETELGGAGMWDVIVPAPETITWDYLRRVQHMENRLRGEVVVPGPDGKPQPGLTKVLSLADAAVAGSTRNPETIGLAPVRNSLVRAGEKLLRVKMTALINALYREDPTQPGTYYLRVMLRAKERQPAAQKRAIIRQVEQICREEFPPSENQPGAEVTGFFVLLTNLVDSVTADQWRTFAVALLGIGIMMLVALRSPRLALIALVPNAAPILVVTGLMGWLGLKINMGAAMIAAVSLGLSIDSSIHYLTTFRRAYAQGGSVPDALAVAHRTTGRALIYASLALIVGFSVLCTSYFVPTIYFGVLVSLAMLGGLAGNLIVLPLLISTFMAGEPSRDGADGR